MKLSDLKIDAQKTCGEKLVCVGHRPVFEYSNKERTNTVIGTNYEIVLLDRSYERLNVKVLGGNTLPEVINGSIPVEFENLEISVTNFNGQIYISGKASKVHQVNNASK